MSEYLLEPHAKPSSPNAETEREREKAEKGLENVDKLQRELSILQSLQVNQCKALAQTLDQTIDRYAKNYSSQKLLQQELERRMLLMSEDLATTEEETREMIKANSSKVEKITNMIKEAESDVQAMLTEKERHRKALEAVEDEVKNKYKELKRLEIEKYHDSESICRYKKLSLMKTIKAVDAEIEAVNKEIDLAQKHFAALKTTNRELRTKYYKLHKP